MSGFRFLLRSTALIVISFLLLSPVRAAESEPAFSHAEIDQMLAPIALYPDVLLSQILMAATYPLEVVQAARWRQANPDLDAEAALAAAEAEDWDPSVKALVAFPRVLEHMDEDLDWTQRLGEAFLFQEEVVMARVQELRRRAWDAGALASPEQARVVRSDNIIIIEPPSETLIYVPYYDPRRVYGSWWWSSHPPYYWGPPRGLQLGVGFVWSSGVRVPSGWIFSTVHWPRQQVIIVPRYRPYQRHFGPPQLHYDGFRDARAWRHDMRHRRGLVYRHGHWRPPAQPPRIGGPREPAAPQRPSILRGTERYTGPNAHQFRHSDPVLDSSDRQVPINPRAGERFRRPPVQQEPPRQWRRPDDARPPTSQPRRESGPRRSDPPRESSRGGGSSRGDSGSAPRQRDSILR
jgi:hypothetical protein